MSAQCNLVFNLTKTEQKNIKRFFCTTRTSLTNTRTSNRTSCQPETTVYQALTQYPHQAHQF
ncbi:MAG: hypothetical protein EA343_03035 [Nodularia sp. (in: Bacteria)]|nr:MAG: hypothetical protein EA343_02735 [Nodularia sp. (in: cyanobacteria)]TVP65619.1 MAG: hypothetical protein EA343_03035 [Nodularia sp. (in: cyanobacteria)]